MAIAAFPYVSFPLLANEAFPHGSMAYRPLAFATITASSGASTRCIVLPDSGADACLFPMSLAILLKLDVLKLPKGLTGGVGSSANFTYYDTITVDLGRELCFPHSRVSPRQWIKWAWDCLVRMVSSTATELNSC
jgi:hypothetical protein